MQNSLNKSLLLFLFLLPFLNCKAQNEQFKNDLLKINSELSHSHPESHPRQYIYSNEPFSIKKINPVGLVFGGLLFFYQNVLSKHFSADCLYSPSCSEFSKLAIKEYGIIKGLFLTIDRVNRCNIIAAQDLKHYSKEPGSNRYPDPVSKYDK